ncbi:MAG TPA: hypothetical protein VHW26_13740 [Solirubrobacteraceae bacterium]|jgi:hypothetical protein|nr:hypothetical protein [Solirubrobacteraceae bacterium]
MGRGEPPQGSGGFPLTRETADVVHSRIEATKAFTFQIDPAGPRLPDG